MPVNPEPRYDLETPEDLDYLGAFAGATDADREAWGAARTYGREILPRMNEAWQKAEYPLDLVAKMGEADLLTDGLDIPGHRKLSPLGAGLVNMEISRWDGSMATALAVQGGLALRSIALFGSEEQKQRYVEDLVTGRVCGAFALTEPEHGSDSVSLETSAVRDGDEYVITGEKKWIGNGAAGGITVVWARDEDGNVRGFIVPQDTPGYEGIHESSARLVGGSYQGAADLLSGSVVHAVNFGGGMHHAAADKASGFCVYNDCAVGIRHLLDHGVGRVAYIDIDAHHGDGTQAIFWDDPRVMTISLHETGMSLFPGTGFANESGPEGEAAGTAVNVALPTRTGDAEWLRAFHAVVPQLVRAFAPEVIVSQHGCDSHFKDDMTHLRLSVDAQREAALSIADLAAELTEDRWIATGGGGYNALDAVPRSWTHLIGIAAGRYLDPATPTPPSWRSWLRERYGVRAPELMGDEVDVWWRSWEIGYDPADDLDRTVMVTRKQVFPLWGLDPWYD